MTIRQSVAYLTVAKKPERTENISKSENATYLKTIILKVDITHRITILSDTIAEGYRAAIVTGTDSRIKIFENKTMPYLILVRLPDI